MGVKKKKSDVLLIFLLKGSLREKARRGLDIGRQDSGVPKVVYYPQRIESMGEWSLRYPCLPSPSGPSH
jgi:hypothetical protein